jgi:hypothetical protein
MKRGSLLAIFFLATTIILVGVGWRFVSLAAEMAEASIFCFKQRKWGWWLTSAQAGCPAPG